MGAISNPKTIREMLRGNPYELSRAKAAIEVSLNYSNKCTLDWLLTNDHSSLNKDQNLLEKVLAFIKDYTEVMLIHYGSYCQEIEE